MKTPKKGRNSEPKLPTVSALVTEAMIASLPVPYPACAVEILRQIVDSHHLVVAERRLRARQARVEHLVGDLRAPRDDHHLAIALHRREQTELARGVARGFESLVAECGSDDDPADHFVAVADRRVRGEELLVVALVDPHRGPGAPRQHLLQGVGVALAQLLAAHELGAVAPEHHACLVEQQDEGRSHRGEHGGVLGRFFDAVGASGGLVAPRLGCADLERLDELVAERLLGQPAFDAQALHLQLRHCSRNRAL
jgi:hypothetical protein